MRQDGPGQGDGGRREEDQREQSGDAEVEQVAASLRTAVSLLMRGLRQGQAKGELTLPETSALVRLDRDGPNTTAALARMEQISPQSMGATLAALEARGLIGRSPDPGDGRRIVMTLTEAGLAVLRDRRTERVRRLAQALAETFTPEELRRLRDAAPLIERLAQHL